MNFCCTKSSLYRTVQMIIFKIYSFALLLLYDFARLQGFTLFIHLLRMSTLVARLHQLLLLRNVNHERLRSCLSFQVDH